jgi:hypothetical protein
MLVESCPPVVVPDFVNLILDLLKPRVQGLNLLSELELGIDVTLFPSCKVTRQFGVLVTAALLVSHLAAERAKSLLHSRYHVHRHLISDSFQSRFQTLNLILSPHIL